MAIFEEFSNDLMSLFDKRVINDEAVDNLTDEEAETVLSILEKAGY